MTPVMGGTTQEANFTNFNDRMMVIMMADMGDPQSVASETWLGLWHFSHS
jgi:hypothetical protein